MRDISELLANMKAHIEQMAPHQQTRQQGALFIEAYLTLRSINSTLEILRADRMQGKGNIAFCPSGVTCPHCYQYYPGHATGSGDICTCYQAGLERQNKI